jgi:hypothetical protein
VLSGNRRWAFEVWHYTNRTGLEGILSSHVLWASESGGLNDPSEVTGAVADLWAIWRLARDLLKPEAPGEEVEAWLQQIGDMTRGRRHFFVSACSGGDKLHHWAAYAGGTGYAIQFDPDQEVRILGTTAAPKLFIPDFAPIPRWRDVTYDRYVPNFTEFSRHGLGWVIEEALSTFAALRQGRLVVDQEGMYDHLERVYLSAVYFHKHEGYEEEEEVRIAVPEPPLDDYVFERDGGYSASGHTSYLKLAAAGDDPDVTTYSINVTPRLPILGTGKMSMRKSPS